MARLHALGPLAPGLGRPALDGRAVGGGRLAGVGGVLAEPLFQLTQAPLQGADTLLVAAQHDREGGLGSRWDLVPQPRAPRPQNRLSFTGRKDRRAAGGQMGT